MVFKRVIAYFIDILIVTFAASMLASISYVNPQLENYNKVYDEYVEFYEDYKANIKDINSSEKVTEYKQKLDDINYRMSRNNIYGAIISITLTFIYFAVFQKYNNGQTLGKKLMSLKVTGNLSLFKYFFRTLILHNAFINTLKVFLILTISKVHYIAISDILYIAALVIEVTILIMVSSRKDNRGLHDIIVGSKVEAVPKVKEV